MPSKPDHRAKAEHNEYLASTLDNPFWDWKVVATFYCALHYVEAYLAGKTPPEHPRSHELRKNAVERDPFLKVIAKDYAHLRDESYNARYYPHIVFTQSDAVDAQKYLETIKSHILPVL